MPVLVRPVPESMPVASLGSPPVANVMVTVSLAPTSGSLMLTVENGVTVALSVVAWPPAAPVITGGSFAAVAITVVAGFVVGEPAMPSGTARAIPGGQGL